MQCVSSIIGNYQVMNADNKAFHNKHRSNHFHKSFIHLIASKQPEISIIQDILQFVLQQC